MSKIIFHQFDTVIYPRKFWVSVAANIDAAKEQFEIDANTFDDDESCDAACYKVRLIDGGKYGILVNFKDKESMSIGNIAHESVHIADYIFQEIGAYSQEFSEKNEPYAYLVGYIAKSIGIVKEETE